MRGDVALLSWLEARPSMELAVMFVTWAAIFLLGLTTASLHYRLLRLEHANRVARAAAPYGHLVGKQVWMQTNANMPRAVLLVSKGCPSCDALLEELRSAPPAWTLAVAWKDGQPPQGALPERITVVPDGSRWTAELGIGVTPFALRLDSEGVVRGAMPVGSLRALGQLMEQAAAA